MHGESFPYPSPKVMKQVSSDLLRSDLLQGVDPKDWNEVNADIPTLTNIEMLGSVDRCRFIEVEQSSRGEPDSIDYLIQEFTDYLAAEQQRLKLVSKLKGLDLEAALTNADRVHKSVDNAGMDYLPSDTGMSQEEQQDQITITRERAIESLITPRQAAALFEELDEEFPEEDEAPMISDETLHLSDQETVDSDVGDSEALVESESSAVGEYSTDHEEEKNAFIERVLALDIGCWVEFKADDGAKIRCKLAAKVKATHRFIFVNRSGIKVADKSVDDLAKELSQGRVKLLDDNLLFDRALESVIGNSRHQETARLN